MRITSHQHPANR